MMVELIEDFFAEYPVEGGEPWYHYTRGGW